MLVCLIAAHKMFEDVPDEREIFSALYIHVDTISLSLGSIPVRFNCPNLKVIDNLGLEPA